jgi:hypothetical protein
LTKIIKIRLLIDSICRQGLNDSETVNLQQLKGQIGLLLEHLRHAGLLSIASVDVSELSRSESALLPTSGSVSQSRKAQHEDALDTTNILREGHDVCTEGSPGKSVRSSPLTNGGSSKAQDAVVHQEELETARDPLDDVRDHISEVMNMETQYEGLDQSYGSGVV